MEARSGFCPCSEINRALLSIDMSAAQQAGEARITHRCNFAAFPLCLRHHINFGSALFFEKRIGNRHEPRLRQEYTKLMEGRGAGNYLTMLQGGTIRRALHDGERSSRDRMPCL